MHFKTLVRIVGGIAAIIFLIVCVYLLTHKTTPLGLSDLGYKDISYSIEGQSTKIDGVSTHYFGNEATGDLNQDGQQDVAFLLTYNGGGTGTFYYAVVALKTDKGYIGTNGIFLGDRIAPQTTEIRNGEVIVNYADRKPTDPMSKAPSVGVSKVLKVSGLMLEEVK